jgi:hypothetical protein
MKKFIASAVILVLAVFGFMTTVKTSAVGAPDSANGHGTVFVQDEQGATVKRQFSLSARRFADGTVKGNAILRNPAFSGENGKTYQVKFEISCMKVVGNTAIFGGTVQRTNDPNLVDTAFFSVEDNGEPGKGKDRISGVLFNDADPNNDPGDPQFCQNFDPSNFEPLNTIDSGNIQVQSGK